MSDNDSRKLAGDTEVQNKVLVHREFILQWGGKDEDDKKQKLYVI